MMASVGVRRLEIVCINALNAYARPHTAQPVRITTNLVSASEIVGVTAKN